MQISVVIVNYKIRDFLYLCLRSVEKALEGIDGEIIVVDNRSEDGSCEMMASYFPEVKRICSNENRGFAYANNAGVREAGGEFVLILNPDTVLPEDNIRKVLSAAGSIHDLGAMGVMMIDGTGHFLPESKRNIPTPQVSFGKLFGGMMRKKYPYYAGHLRENESGYADIIAGAYMLIRKSVYEESGGFDERYFMYGEDIDLSYSLLQRGLRNYYYADSPILHFKGESTSKDLQYLKRFYGAMHLFYKKYFAAHPLLNFTVNAGIRYKYLSARLRLNAQHTAKQQPQHILYAGNDNHAYEKLSGYFRTAEMHIFAVCSTRVISRWDDLEKMMQTVREKQIDTLVFDTSAHDFEKILFYMYEMRHLGLQYRFYVAETGLLIGSNSPDDKGEAIQIG